MSKNKEIKKEIKEEFKKEIKEEFEDITFTPEWTLMMFLGLLNDLTDWISVFVNLTGIWLIINWLCDGIFFFIFFSWRFWKVMEKGFSLSNFLGNWKQIVSLVLELIPGVEDVVPGCIIYFMFGRKQKIKTKLPKPKT